MKSGAVCVCVCVCVGVWECGCVSGHCEETDCEECVRVRVGVWGWC